jgi:hypothetical protein
MVTFDLSSPTVQAAILSVTGVLVSVASTLYVARRNVHKDARSRARVEWISALRISLSGLIASVDRTRRAKLSANGQSIAERSTELVMRQSEMLLLLSDAPHHCELSSKISACVNSVMNESLGYDPSSDLQEIFRAARKVIDIEWKKASHGK